MVERDLILDGSYTPSFGEICEYVNQSARELWKEINSFIQQKYKVVPKVAYSKCAGKPGWNVKYQKSGKSLCTLYPEKDGFVALVVVKLDLVAVIEGMQGDFKVEVLEIVRSAKPFNGTLWLMINVDNQDVLDNVKQLLLLKQPLKKV